MKKKFNIGLMVFLTVCALLGCTFASANVVALSNSPSVSASDLSDKNFMTLADIHFTPYASCVTTHPCPFINKLKQSPASQWDALFSAENMPMPAYFNDTNATLLNSALASAGLEASNKNIKFVMVLGDNLGHDYRRLYKFYTGDLSYAGYQAFVSKTYQYLNIKLNNAFPNRSVYMVMGNNDSYRGDYATQMQGAFFQDQGTLWSKLIRNADARNSMRSQFSQNGYYAVNLPELNNIRLIVLNTNLFSNKARGKEAENLRLAMNELTWLHTQLTNARSAHQTVFIATHIPEGIDVYATVRLRGFALIEFWRTEYIKQYQDEMNEFASNIAAIFAGHLHTDWMQILRYEKLYEIPVTGTPSISPVFGNNPGYKIYTYSPGTKKIIDFQTYYLPLNGKQLWSMEYQFNHVYQSNCHNCAVTAGIDLIKMNGSMMDYYREFYKVSAQNTFALQHWDPYYSCAIWHPDIDSYKQCVS